MNISQIHALEKQASQLRRRELKRLLDLVVSRLGNVLREQHETWLRRQGRKRINAPIGTPV
jgi:hypothetical protein